jgi:regulatory protein
MGPAAELPALSSGLDDPAKRLLRLAIAALARREHSRVEIERKLLRRLQGEETAADIHRVLDRLQSRGLLSDQRMAQALVRSRATRYGRLRLQQELQRRGVDRETIAASLPPAADESAAALALWQRKFGQPAATPEERARQGRFLAARGFAASVIGRILSIGEES